MTKIATRLLMILSVLALSVFAIAETKSTSGTLAAQIQSRLAGVAPNTIVISVDESGKMARMRGTISSQAEMDRLTEAVRGISGVRVTDTDLRVSGGSAGTATTRATRSTEMTRSDTGTRSDDDTQSTTSDRDEMGSTTGSADELGNTKVDPEPPATAGDRTPATGTATTGAEKTREHVDRDTDTSGDESSSTGTSSATTGSMTATSSNSLSAQIDQRLTNLSPRTVVVIVDESAKTAYVRGNVSSQEEADHVTKLLEGISGLTVLGTNVTTTGSSPSES